MLSGFIIGVLCFAAGHIIGSWAGFEKGYYKCFKDNLISPKSCKAKSDTQSIRTMLNNVYDGEYES